jgi:hypothetical protein
MDDLYDTTRIMAHTTDFANRSSGFAEAPLPYTFDKMI